MFVDNMSRQKEHFLGIRESGVAKKTERGFGTLTTKDFSRSCRC